MLFNSYPFVLVFLPLTLVGFFLVGRFSPPGARLFLLAASFAFYGYWSVFYLGLLIVSILANYALGGLIAGSKPGAPRAASMYLAIGVAGNLGILAYYKYATFVLDTVRDLTGLQHAVEGVILPLAISFYTFQQIAFLVDTWRSDARPSYSLLDYALFVTFFPQLIAGPIVHHATMIPQFSDPKIYRFDPRDAAIGLGFFVIGLAKKLLIADTVGGLSDPVFDGALVSPPTAAEAWLALAAFSIGLYFDFSGYSDMAVGLARMFGIRIPYNFASPYQATSIVEFWKRWHITLSTWLRDFLYIPLGGNRRGPVRRYGNLMITMLLGGLWHGAGWTFVIWGGLHGLYLMINHAWHALVPKRRDGRGLLPPLAGWLVTMAAVGFAWIFFRAPTLEHAAAMISGLGGLNPLPPPAPEIAVVAPPLAERPIDVLLHGALRRLEEAYPAMVLTVAAGIAFLLPNSQDLLDGLSRRQPRLRRLALTRFRPNHAWAAATAFLFLVALTRMSDVKAFVYFQF